ncbi:MAG: hypothetical protein ACREJD_03815 [Phycisphaerales bacterium]
MTSLQSNEHRVSEIRLDQGSDVTLLRVNAELRVSYKGASSFRLFSIVSANHIAQLFATNENHNFLFTTGGRLIVVSEVTGSTIVASVMRYLELEQHRGGL